MADSYKNHMYALVMAGGGGTRLWPLSREETPKQFLRLFGKESLFEITVKRLSKDISCVKLIPENSKYHPILIKSTDDFEIWGIVTFVIRKI